MSRSVVTNDHLKHSHQLLIEIFMSKMRSDKQSIPTAPTMPSLEIRQLRARLMLEECLETIELGLGLNVIAEGQLHSLKINGGTFTMEERREGPNLIEIADGCADVEVVTTGTASACGIAHAPIFKLVMGNNLRKFAPGHFFREDGKLVKPTDHPPVTNAILNELMAQGFNPQV